MKRILIAIMLGILLMGCCGSCNGCDSIAEECSSTLPIVSYDEFENGDSLIIQFSADWCAPCRRLKQTIKSSGEIQKYFKEKTRGYFIIDVGSTDKNDRKWIKRANPVSIPLVVSYVYKDGQWIENKRFIGGKSEQGILSWLKG